MIMASAEGLAESLNASENERSLLYPEIHRIREVSVVVTRKVIRVAQKLVSLVFFLVVMAQRLIMPNAERGQE